MATAAKRALRTVDDAGDGVSDALFDQIAALRKEIAAISDVVSDYGAHQLGDVQYNARALAKEMRQQGAVVARQVGHQASVAGKGPACRSVVIVSPSTCAWPVAASR